MGMKDIGSAFIVGGALIASFLSPMNSPENSPIKGAYEDLGALGDQVIEVYEAVKDAIPPALPVLIASSEPSPQAAEYISSYKAAPGGAAVEFSGGTKLVLPKPGRHMAINALCIGV
jgi:hypothetical protein